MEVQEPVEERVRLFITGVPLRFQAWTKESRFQTQKQSREKGTTFSQGTSVVISDLSCTVTTCIPVPALTMNVTYIYRKQNHRNSRTVQPKQSCHQLGTQKTKVHIISYTAFTYHSCSVYHNYLLTCYYKVSTLLPQRTTFRAEAQEMW